MDKLIPHVHQGHSNQWHPHRFVYINYLTKFTQQARVTASTMVLEFGRKIPSPRLYTTLAKLIQWTT